MIYTYDASLEGFFSCVFVAYSKKETPSLITAQSFQPALGEEVRPIQTDQEQASRVSYAIERHLGIDGIHDLKYAFANCDPYRETVILRFLRLVFKHGNKTRTMFSEPAVIEFNQLVYATSHEVHRMKGFLRFSKSTSGIYYAKFEPDHDVMEFILPHFAARLNDSTFVIHDLKRHKMGLYDGEKQLVVKTDKQVILTLSEDELAVRKLWQEYFINVNIPERKRERQQMQFLPKRYRKHMTEFDQFNQPSQ